MEPKLLPHALLFIGQPINGVGSYKVACTMIYLRPNRNDRSGTVGPIPTEIIGIGESTDPIKAIGNAIKDSITQLNGLNNPKCIRRAE